jgi:hypothetical protein
VDNDGHIVVGIGVVVVVVVVVAVVGVMTKLFVIHIVPLLLLSQTMPP